MDNLDIRNKLQELLSISSKKSNYEKLIDYINELSSQSPKEIKFINSSDERRRCYDYAFDTQISHKNAVAALLSTNNILREVNSYEIGKQIIVIYFVNNQPVHAGKVIAIDLIESKWDKGPIVQHKPFVSPSSYGNEIKYLEIIDNEKAKDFLKNYNIT